MRRSKSLERLQGYLCTIFVYSKYSLYSMEMITSSAWTKVERCLTHPSPAPRCDVLTVQKILLLLTLRFTYAYAVFRCAPTGNDQHFEEVLFERRTQDSVVKRRAGV